MSVPTNLHDLFLHDLQDLYNAEKQLTKALPKLAKASTNAALKAGFTAHLADTEKHLTRLEGVFAAIGAKVKGKHCDGMAGLIEEGASMIAELEKGPVLDAALAAAAQKCEHYEICAYGTLHAYAQLMESTKPAALLLTTLEEEKAANAKLTALAESTLNRAANNAGAGETDARTPASRPVRRASGTKRR